MFFPQILELALGWHSQNVRQISYDHYFDEGVKPQKDLDYLS